MLTANVSKIKESVLPNITFILNVLLCVHMDKYILSQVSIIGATHLYN